MISQEKCTRPTDSVNNSLKFRRSSSPRAASVFSEFALTSNFSPQAKGIAIGKFGDFPIHKKHTFCKYGLVCPFFSQNGINSRAKFCSLNNTILGESKIGVSAAMTAAAARRWRPAWQRSNGGGGVATVEAAPRAVTVKGRRRRRRRRRR
jgi:hypothetical protein